MLAEALDNSQNLTRLIPESRSCTLNSSGENLRTRIPAPPSVISVCTAILRQRQWSHPWETWRLARPKP
jgi:hypothetical protein